MREKDKKRDNHLFTLAITTISHWKLVLPPIHLNAWPEESSFKKEVSGFLMRIGFVQEVECHLKNLNLTHKRMHSHRLLKIKVHYWHWWFHEELLTSMEPFHSTKGSLCWKKGSLDSNVLCNKKNVFFLECFTEWFFGEPKRLFSPMASLWKPLFWKPLFLIVFAENVMWNSTDTHLSPHDILDIFCLVWKCFHLRLDFSLLVWCELTLLCLLSSH